MDNYFFKSKKNRVSLITQSETAYVKKEFLNLCDKQNEEKIYRLLEPSGIAIPTLLSADENAVYLSYVNGKTMLEVLEEQESKIDYLQWDCLVKALADLYKELAERTGQKLCMKDLNLRNFIYHDLQKCVYILDFELCEAGDYEQDLGNLLAHLCTYFPAYTKSKLSVADYLHRQMKVAMDLEEEKIEFYVKNETEKIINRRKQRLSEKKRTLTF